MDCLLESKWHDATFWGWFTRITQNLTRHVKFQPKRNGRKAFRPLKLDVKCHTLNDLYLKQAPTHRSMTSFAIYNVSKWPKMNFAYFHRHPDNSVTSDETQESYIDNLEKTAIGIGLLFTVCDDPSCGNCMMPVMKNQIMLKTRKVVRENFSWTLTGNHVNSVFGLKTMIFALWSLLFIYLFHFVSGNY